MSNKSILARYGLILILASISAVYFLPVVSSQNTTKAAIPGADKKDITVSIQAKGRGFPRVSFEDGIELADQGNANPNGGSLKLATSADFDSDGTADLMTIDAGGGVRFHRGNVASIYQTGETVDGTNEERASQAPFFASSKVNDLPISPDFAETGDLNADGHPDLLVAAKGGDRLYVLAGNGAGGFAHTTEFTLAGSISGITTGEIGSQDGQTDVAVAIETGKGPLLLVFEHPEGAFVHPPEVIRLSQKANDLAIGHLDTDYFGDVAVASGNRLTIVRGRGQAHPWDKMPEYGVQRPAPLVETRGMPFEIAALTAGHFTEKRGQNLAMLTTTGTIQTIDSPAAENQRSKLKLGNLEGDATPSPVKAMGQSLSKYRTLSEYSSVTSEPASMRDMYKMENGVPVPVDPTETKAKELTDKQRAEFEAGGTNLDPEARERTKQGFLRSISPSASQPLSRWTLQTIVTDSRLASAANLPSTDKLVKVRVSDAGRDELAVLDGSLDQIHLMIRENRRRDDNAAATEIVSLDVDAAPAAILPMRLNIDAFSDLVVLREGSDAPSVVMTSPSVTFVVTTANDEDNDLCGGSCSLREAIKASNISGGGAGIINFNISGQTIHPLTALPRINSPVTINGPTGAGGQPLIEISGDLGHDGDNGLSINAPNVVIRGLAINRFRTLENDDGDLIGGSAISIFNFVGETDAQFCIIEGNYLGTDRTGSLDRGNQQAGLFIFDSDHNTVGGPATAARNVISGNGNGEVANGDFHAPGILIVDGGLTLVQRNYVGVTASGLTRLANSNGIQISGAQNLVLSNLVSGNTHSSPSTFDPQGCGGDGIGEESVINVTTGEFVTKNGIYSGNILGLNAAGNAAISNCRTGMSTSPRNTATIGSTSESGRNTISGNTDGGLFCTTRPRSAGGFRQRSLDIGITIPEGSCKIIGNNIGTDVTGSFAIPNDHRRGDQTFSFNGALVVYNTDTFSTVGGRPGTSDTSCTGHCNLVSGNGTPGGYDTVQGIAVEGGLGTVGIWKNYVGTNKSGTAAVGNYIGISGFLSGSHNIGDVVNEGGTDYSYGNLVSGNRQGGIGVNTGTSPTTIIVQIRGNLVGTDVTGITAIPNNSDLNPFTAGVSLFSNSVAILGGSNPLARNVISGNNGTGLVFGSAVLTTASVNNYIGVNKNGDPLGNTLDGVRLNGTFDYLGDNNGVGNIIANNGRNGILATGPTTRGNRFKYNSIYNNGALGIDLSAAAGFNPDGVTENDCGDLDTGANTLQNYPILTTPVFNGDGTVTVGGAFGSVASKTFTLDFYSNSSADPSDYGEGQTHIGSKSVTTDADGKTAFSFTSPLQVAPGLKITATASDIDGNTSEFSCYAGRCSISGGLSEQESAMKMAGGGCSLGYVVNINTDQEDPNPADGICDVNLNTPEPDCSLRAAIQTTNAIAGTDFIFFDIPGAGVHMINANFLPTITQPVLINGRTQPGYVDKPLIQVNQTGAFTRGFEFAPGSDGSNLMGLSINRFEYGIVIKSDGNTIEDCFIGLDADGVTVPEPGERQITGIEINGKNNIIKGTRDETTGFTTTHITGNTVSGVSIDKAGATGNKVIGVNFGTFYQEKTPKERYSQTQIEISDMASMNTIGGTTNGEANLIGLADYGLAVDDGGSDNTISHNLFFQCEIGVLIGEASNTIIGGTLADGRRNQFHDNEAGIVVGLDHFPGGGRQLSRSAPSTHRRSYGGRRARHKNGTIDPAAGTKIYGNVIGLHPDLISSENDIGVVVQYAENTELGSGTFGQHNFISNNLDSGVFISPSATGTKVSGNFIGTNLQGQGIAANNTGVFVTGSHSEVSHNVISGNNLNGINVQTEFDGDPTPTFNLISNNHIGTNAAGTNAIPNGTNGLQLVGNQNTVTQNVIAGNEFVAIGIFGDNNIILNNKVGTNEAGTASIPNVLGGIGVIGSGNAVRQNLVSGNRYGVFLREDPDGKLVTNGNTVDANTIGPNVDMTAPISNEFFGIALRSASANRIINNIVAGNGSHGMVLEHGSNNNIVRGNYIGITPAGLSMSNGGAGIRITVSSTGNQIGGNTIPPAPIARRGPNAMGEDMVKNVVAHNGNGGIIVTSDAGISNVIGSNSVFDNTGSGIDLGDNGPTPNDPQDADTGPNNLQNYPVLSRQIVAGDLIVTFKVDSAPTNSAYGTNGLYIEFFKADASGEGEKFLGWTYYTETDYNNGTPLGKTVNLGSMVTLGVTSNDRITATATDANGNTSEFTPAAGPTASMVSVAGRVMTQDGRGLRSASVTITDSRGIARTVTTSGFGYYTFQNVSAGETYVIGVTSRRYTFATRVLFITDSVTGIDFWAE